MLEKNLNSWLLKKKIIVKKNPVGGG